MVVPNFLFIKKYRYIKLMVSTKKISHTIVFNTDLEPKKAY